MTLNFLPLVAFHWTHGLEIGLPATAGLASIALIGYLFGKRTRLDDQAQSNAQRQQELERASGIAHQLEAIAGDLRQDLANHHGRLAQFRRRLSEAQSSAGDETWTQLCAEAESMLSPTMQLAEQLALAYDAIRQQSDALETFTQARTDSTTGVGNGRALEEKLEVLLATAQRSHADFSIALLSLDRDFVATSADGEAVRKNQLRELAKLIQSCARDSDYVARYGDEEFVVVMPQTTLAGACVFGDRLLKSALKRMDVTISCGVADYQVGDDGRSLLSRADSAFYSAKAAGGNRQFVHNGSQIREHRAAGTSRETEAMSASPQPPFDGAADGFLSAAEPTAIR